jgi:hypothetical protein
MTTGSEMNALMLADNFYFLISWVLKIILQRFPYRKLLLVLLEGLTDLGMAKAPFSNFSFKLKQFETQSI